MKKVTITLTKEQAKELQPLFDIITARNKASATFDFAIVAQPEMIDTVNKKVEVTCALVDMIARDTIRGAIKDMKTRENQANAMRDAIKAAEEAT